MNNATNDANKHAQMAHILIRERYKHPLTFFPFALRAKKYCAILLAACAALLLASCPPEAKTTAKPQRPSPVISYCGVDGITSLTLVMGETPQQLTASPTASWSSSDDTLASVAADGTITLTKATAPNTPVFITAASGTKTASFELTVLTAGSTPDIAVKTEADLRLMGCADGVSRLDATYTLANDITLTKEWEPVGDNTTPFTGTLDGAGHTIKNLFINKPNSDYIGLIGKNTGSIKDIGVEVGTQGITGLYYVGGLVGENDGGSVSGVVSGAGSITSSNTVPPFIGGLVGFNNGSGGTVIGISLVDVSARSSTVGGLVGANSDGSVTGYATGNISGAGYLGGLAGNSSRGTVLGYYVFGTVSSAFTSGTAIGGLVGVPPSTLTGYSRGAVSSANISTGNTAQGRLVGLAPQGSEVVNAYYSGKAGESAFTGGTANNEGKGSITITAATKATDFAGFDFTSNDPDWEFVSGKWPAIKFPADQSIFDPYRGDKQPINP